MSSATYLLSRSGDAPLAVTGTLLLDLAGPHEPGQRCRYHRLALYALEPSGLAVQVDYLSSWPHEPSWHDAAVLPDAAALRAYLRQHDPCAHVQGYPRRPVYADRQAALLSALRDHWAALVSECLSHLALTEEPRR